MSLDTSLRLKPFTAFGDGDHAQLLGNPIGSSFVLDEKFGKRQGGIGVEVKKSEAGEMVFHGMSVTVNNNFNPWTLMVYGDSTSVPTSYVVTVGRYIPGPPLEGKARLKKADMPPKQSSGRPSDITHHAPPPPTHHAPPPS